MASTLGFGGVLKIQADQLLLAANDTQLHGGLQVGITPEVGADTGLGHNAFKLVAGFVVTHHGEQGSLGSEASRVKRDVGSAPAAFFFAGDAHHGYWCFGADAVDRTVPVAVKHDIAHHKNTGGGNGCFFDFHKTCFIALRRGGRGSCPRFGSRGIAKSAAWPQNRRRHSGSV